MIDKNEYQRLLTIMDGLSQAVNELNKNIAGISPVIRQHEKQITEIKSDLKACERKNDILKESVSQKFEDFRNSIECKFDHIENDLNGIGGKVHSNKIFIGIACALVLFFGPTINHYAKNAIGLTPDKTIRFNLLKKEDE